MPQISIIVCTRNRAERLPVCLNSIEQAAVANRAVEVELVIVNNGSTDATAAVLQVWQQSASVRCRVLLSEQRGLSHARNYGLEQATGKILAFTDDDCTVAPDYLTQLARAYASDAGPALRGGRVELGNPRDLPFTIKTDLAPQRFTGGHPGGFIHGCNLTMSRSALELVGRFDTRLGAGQPIGAAEDSDFVYRAYRSGVMVLYDPSILVFHHHGRRDFAEVKLLQDAYNLGNGALYAKHGPRDWKLLLRLGRDIRSGLWEYCGGPLADKEFGLSHRKILRGNLRGAMRFWLSSIGGINRRDQFRDGPIK
jgi:glycosyltransferase involved in cell wall biosynthesis